MNLVEYFIEANVALLIISIAHAILLRNDTRFSLARVITLIGIAGGVTFPFVHISHQEMGVPVLIQALPTVVLPELVVGSTQRTPSTLSLSELVAGIYLAVVLVKSCILTVRLSRLLLWIGRQPKTYLNGYRIIESNHFNGQFSFFNTIVLGGSNALSAPEKEIVLKHESFHALRFHAIDLLFLQLLAIVFWFNPAVYYLKWVLNSIHEYEADRHCATIMDRNVYCALLANRALLAQHMSFVNHFNKSQILNRLAMLNTTKQRAGALRIAAMITVLVVLFFNISCNEQFESNGQQNRLLVEQTSMSRTTSVAFDQFKKAYPGYEFSAISLENNETGIADFEASLTGQGKYFEMKLHEDKDRGRIFQFYAIIDKKDLERQLSDSDDIVVFVDFTAEPPMGYQEFYRQLGERMRYPSDARQQGIEGKVFVEFVIDKNGMMGEFNVIKGISADCDAEAIKVLESMSTARWNPGRKDGKIVRQRMVLPITFKLG